jgi:hypothetical protein
MEIGEGEPLQMEDWTVDDVCNYFEGLGVVDVSKLRDGMVDGVALSEFSEKDLVEVGIPIGVRKKYFRNLKAKATLGSGVVASGETHIPMRGAGFDQEVFESASGRRWDDQLDEPNVQWWHWILAVLFPCFICPVCSDTHKQQYRVFYKTVSFWTAVILLVVGLSVWMMGVFVANSFASVYLFGVYTFAITKEGQIWRLVTASVVSYSFINIIAAPLTV